MRKHKFLIFSRKYAQYLVHLILYLSRIKWRKIYLCIIVFDSSLTLQILEKNVRELSTPLPLVCVYLKQSVRRHSTLMSSRVSLKAS